MHRRLCVAGGDGGDGGDYVALGIGYASGDKQKDDNEEGEEAKAQPALFSTLVTLFFGTAHTSDLQIHESSLRNVGLYL